MLGLNSIPARLSGLRPVAIAALAVMCFGGAPALAQVTGPGGPPMRDTQRPELQRPNAQRPDASGSNSARPREPAPAPLTLSGLYDKLKSAATPEEAQALVRQIARRWNRSGSDTSDVLMQRAKQSLASQQGPLAVELLDRVITLNPGWAEAWHVRGMAFFIMQDDFRAIADFREALRREPGHFMALGMTAAALQRQGDQAAALKAFRAVQSLNPHFEGVKAAIEKLSREVDGRDA